MDIGPVNVTLLEDDSTINLFDLDPQYKLLLIDFWHDRCSYCIKPLTEFIAKSHSNKHSKFVACALNTGETSYQDTKDILSELPETGDVTFTFAHEKEHIKSLFSIQTVPHCLVMERQDSNLQIIFNGHPKDFNFDKIS